MISQFEEKKHTQQAIGFQTIDDRNMFKKKVHKNGEVVVDMEQSTTLNKIYKRRLLKLCI